MVGVKYSAIIDMRCLRLGAFAMTSILPIAPVWNGRSSDFHVGGLRPMLLKQHTDGVLHLVEV